MEYSFEASIFENALSASYTSIYTILYPNLNCSFHLRD
jgi:hypothetical protein